MTVIRRLGRALLRRQEEAGGVMSCTFRDVRFCPREPRNTKLFPQASSEDRAHVSQTRTSTPTESSVTAAAARLQPADIMTGVS